MPQPQPGNDPGTTKLLDGNNGPPGQKCPQGRHAKKEEDQNQGVDLETAALHQCRGQYGAVQGPLRQEPPCWVQRCAATELEGVEKNSGQEPAALQTVNTGTDGNIRDRY